MTAMYGRAVEISCVEMETPMLSTDLPRTSILQEVAANVNQTYKNKLGLNNPPIICYMENVLPVSDGLTSLEHKEEVVVSISSFNQNMINGGSFHGNNGKDFVWGYKTTPTGRVSIKQLGAATGAGKNTWRTESVAGTGVTSTGNVDGEQYFYAEGDKLYKFDPVTIAFSAQAVVGVTIANFKIFTAASGYALLFDANTVYWDSPTTRFNFTPGLGAGGSQKIIGLRGVILAAVPLDNGFIIYTNANAISAKYSGNPNFPWIFKEVAGSAGVDDTSQIANSQNLDYHIAWTSNGLQQVTATRAENILPEFLDFINRRTVESIYQPTGVITRTVSGTALPVCMTLVAGRWLCLSYGLIYPEFTHCWIYDLALKRWGKIVFPHRFVFEKFQSQFDIQYVHSTCIGLVDADGKVHYFYPQGLDEERSDATFNSAIVVGRVSFYKNRPTTLYEIEVQSVLTPTNVQVGYWPSDDDDVGSMLSTIYNSGYGANNGTRKSRRYYTRHTAKYFALYFCGRFQLTNIMLQADLAGAR